MKNNNQKIIDYTIKLYEKLQEERTSLESVWQQVVDYVRPQRSLNPQNGGNSKEIYDATASRSSEMLISGIWSLVNSSAGNWFNLKFSNNELAQNEEALSWLASANKLMKDNLNEASSGFYYKSYEFYADLVCFGTSIFYLGEDITNKKIVYQSEHLGKVFIHQSYHNIDTIIKSISMNTNQSVEFFGLDKVSSVIRKAYKEGKEDTHIFLHLTIPAKYFNDKLAIMKGMKFSSIYIDIEDKSIVLQSGYYEFPYMIARWYTNSNQDYGQSPATISLPDIKMINAMSKTMLIAAQKQIDPPILAPNEASIQGIKANPGGIIYGGIDPLTGNQLIKPLITGGDISNSHELQEQRREAIKEAFYYNLLLSNYKVNATATEVLTNEEQKLRILGPKIARIQTEFLYPLLKRLFSVMLRLNLFPQPPCKISALDVEVDFFGPWNRYNNLSSSLGLNQLYSTMSNINQYDAGIKDMVNWEEVMNLTVAGNGLPNNIINQKINKE
jgi:hypothetical protein